jgi:hypothetical protein
MLLLLSACNYPETADYSQDPVVATNVALILTQGAQTQEAAELSLTATPSASETETPPTETQANPETATQAEPSETPTSTEVLSTDPWSGEAAFVEEFDSGDYWDFESGFLYSKVSNGQLEFTSKGTPWWSSWYTTTPEFKNGYVETTFSMPNCQGQDRFGLVIRWQRPGVFYYMGVTCDGKWGFSQYTAGNETIDLLPYEEIFVLKPVGETNQIGIMAEDNSITFYINRQFVGSILVNSEDEAGNFGFLSMSSGSKNFKTLIDKLEYWE